VPFVLVFVGIPLAELALLIYIGNLIGVWSTILIVVTTGIVGALLAKQQGIATLSRIRGNVERGILPSDDLLQGVLILIGGLLLLTPGIITDLAGFAMLIPPTRRIVTRWLQRLLQGKISRGETHYWRIR
jgi:UPF0716 protein FxsA